MYLHHTLVFFFVQAHSKRESELERQLTEARSLLENREAEMRRLLWEREDALKEKDLHIQKCV